MTDDQGWLWPTFTVVACCGAAVFLVARMGVALILLILLYGVSAYARGLHIGANRDQGGD